MNTEVTQIPNGIATERLTAFALMGLKQPQIDCPVTHHFGPNIYIREIVIPTDTVLVGKRHKTEHICNMISGRMIMVNEDGERMDVVAPCVFMAKKGRKSLFIIETVRFQNIFSTSETDIAKLEDMLVDNTPLLEAEK
tara:strand:- start:109 stop:522 length:414 start_codon:yes stop_codon:yes gene_type:complete